MAGEKEYHLTEEASAPFLEAMSTALSRHKDYRVAYEQQLYERWQEPLELFEHIVGLGRVVSTSRDDEGIFLGTSGRSPNLGHISSGSNGIEPPHFKNAHHRLSVGKAHRQKARS